MRKVDWMSVTNRQGSAHDELFRYHGNGREHEKTLDMGIVGSFEGVRCKGEMISNPNGVKAIGFGLFCSFQAFFNRRLLTKVWQQQAKL